MPDEKDNKQTDELIRKINEADAAIKSIKPEPPKELPRVSPPPPPPGKDDEK